MSEPIKVGDLVYVARDCCGAWVGWTFFVVQLHAPQLSLCPHCHYKNVHTLAENPSWDCPGQLCYAPVEWLRRIPPLSELESEQHKEEIEA